MSSKNSFIQVIGMAATGTRVEAASLIRENPELAAVLSKLIRPKETAHYNKEGYRSTLTPDLNRFRHTGEITGQAITDGKTVMELLPDITLAGQILVSCILSPKDLMGNELNFKVTEGLFVPEVSAMMINAINRHFDKVHKIKPLMVKMLHDSLFETGSYGLAVIPENSIDDVINGHRHISMEDFSGSSLNRDGTIKSIGLLGNPTQKPQREHPGIAVESFSYAMVNNHVDGRVNLSYIDKIDTVSPPFVSDDDKKDKGYININSINIAKEQFDTFITVTDNIDVLKLPDIAARIREDKVKNLLSKTTSRAMENFYNQQEKRSLHGKDALTDRELAGLIYKDGNYQYRAFNSLKTPEQLSRRSVGNPLCLHVPSESIIPIFVPGAPEKQIGFFVLIDEDGNPINKTPNSDYYQQLSARMNTNSSFPSAMLSKVRTMIEGFNSNNHNHLNYSVKVYADMIEQDLMLRLRNGAYQNGVSLARNEEVFRVMFARSLSRQHTQLLFIPIELMTYVAFRYNENGIGVSILESMKIINSLRSMVMFSNTMASIRNSIGRTTLNVKLDENDPDPYKTLEDVGNEIIRSRQKAFPLGVNSPADQVDFLQRAGYEIQHEGHPGLPDIKVEFSEHNSSYAKVDQELDDNLRKKSIQATGMTPETVDAGFNAEFATQIISQNLLLSKRVMQLQEIFLPFITSHARKYAVNSECLLNELSEILENHFDKLQLDKAEVTSSAPNSALYELAPDEIKTTEQAAKNGKINQLLNDFLMNLEATLPQPNTVTLENQSAALEIFVRTLDASLDAYISPEFLTNDIVGKIGNDIAAVKAAYRAYFIRQWLTENGVLPELSNITAINEDGNPILDIAKITEDHAESIMKTSTNMLAALFKVKQASDKVVDDIGAGEDTGTSNSSSGGEFGGGGDFGFGGGGNEGGENSFDFGNPTEPGQENSSTEFGNTPEETNQTNEENQTGQSIQTPEKEKEENPNEEDKNKEKE